MKVICNTLELSEACQNVQRAVSNKTSIPALEGILIDAKENIKLNNLNNVFVISVNV